MMIHDFSQLPVMQGVRDVKGIITWETIGKKQFQNDSCQFVRDCMEVTFPEVSSDSSIFAAIDLIVKRGYTLVRQSDKTVSGIVTTSDLSLQFRQLAEPFLLVGEIENQIRRLIDGKYSTDQLRLAIDPDNAREVSGAADLTFGEYLRLLEKPERWEALSVPIDRKIFIQYLDKIREIRNDVMHFDPDPFEKDELEMLRSFADFMRDLVEN
jgi:predicted transcriptional regulator